MNQLMWTTSMWSSTKQRYSLVVRSSQGAILTYQPNYPYQKNSSIFHHIKRILEYVNFNKGKSPYSIDLDPRFKPIFLIGYLIKTLHFNSLCKQYLIKYYHKKHFEQLNNKFIYNSKMLLKSMIAPTLQRIQSSDRNQCYI